MPGKKLLLTETNSASKMMEVLQLAVRKSEKSVFESKVT